MREPEHLGATAAHGTEMVFIVRNLDPALLLRSLHLFQDLT